MYPLVPESAASMKITVTSTATELYALMDTAGSISSSRSYYTNLFANALLIRPENGDIRVLPKVAPTSTDGVLLKSGCMYYFAGMDLNDFRLIRTSGNVTCTVQIGRAGQGESNFASSVDTVSLSLDEFPAASAASDAYANPTTTDVKSFNMGYNGTTWDRLRSGFSAVQTVLTGFLNVLGMGVYNATPPTLADGNAVANQTDNRGNLKVIIQDGANKASVDTAGIDGESNTSSRLNTRTYLSSFNGSTWDRIRSAVTTVSSTLTGMINTLPWAIYNTTPTARTNGQGGPLQADANGALNTNPGAISSSTDSIAAHNSASASVTGTDPYFNSALSNTAVNIKASAGNFYGWDQIYNSGALCFVQMFNVPAASVTLGTTTPFHSYMVPAAGTFDNKKTVPITCASGISTAATATATGSGAPGASQNANASYK